ncbi:hypothetical protein CONLIGDRAFT_711987 [Coniochaeta ligniaria NRRL 30616]|uniref:NAD(P)-binding protein n=1 Tax=Coniochaeta ligniaria NRRL 30616 TaxID=1408157 RepID=A0A1J7J354_9PEZI|nr:hypothetical protein CONLIGDRAFT_711987 [Coniochaeta ligniaria NRRL 30616]
MSNVPIAQSENTAVTSSSDITAKNVLVIARDGAKFSRHYKGPFLAIKHFYPALQRNRQSKIINISSDVASMSSLIGKGPGRSLGYRLSKTALSQFTVSLGREFRSHDSGVTDDAIHPRWVPTAIWGFICPDDMDV